MIGSTHVKAHGAAASLPKKGCSPPYRPHERRAELQAARHLCNEAGKPLAIPLSEAD